MKANYTTSTSVNKNNAFFYLFNWISLNKVELFGFTDNKDEKRKHEEYCIGVWKIKKLK